MKKLFCLAAVLCMAACAPKGPVQLIFETDMGNDVDDVVALAMIHTYVQQGDVNLLMVGVNKDRPTAPDYIQVFNDFYGRGDVPIGMVHDGAKTSEQDFCWKSLRMTNEDGSPVYRVAPKTYQDAVSLYRKVLSKARNHSVVIASIGFSTNIARLLESGPDGNSSLSGTDLVKKKVARLVVMAGSFPESKRTEYNVRTDVPSAQKVFSDWPTDIWISPWELGAVVKFPATSVENDFAWAGGHHPLVDGYVSYLPMPYDREMWDPTAVLCAVEGPGAFTVNGPYAITIDDEGHMFHEDNPKGGRYILSVDDAQAKAVLERIVSLATKDSRKK